ncbi:Polyketide synthase, type III [Penicillium digitatum]|uniref:Polyketide synthase, type III n=1 Tax=Penicillium digitatum TaxID=36651 RepID=A0A7T6XFA7_PENDI|nr:Polyketide synthase, type III [Penicillium digitatum]
MVRANALSRCEQSGDQTAPPTQPLNGHRDQISDLTVRAGVDLAVEACQKALGEAHVDPEQITHTIGITCTNQGNPGYDLPVALQLKLASNVDRMLLHGVGCAGGLSILRAAAQIAGGASLRRKPARILAFACELCTPNVRRYLSIAENSPDSDHVNIAAVLFSDAAAALVLCNEYAMARDDQATPLYRLLEWGHDLIPDTAELMIFYADTHGYQATLDRAIPQYTKHAIGPMFERLLPSYEEQIKSEPRAGGTMLRSFEICDFDWALHPGGRPILDGVAQILQLSKDQLQVSREIYRTRGNSSSASILVVLDQLRLQSNKEHVIATSFGPGLALELALLRRCSVDE